MPWLRGRKSKDENESPPAENPGPDAPATSGQVARGGTVLMPAHLQHIISERERSFEPSGSAPVDRRAVLERKRLAIQFDIDQGELASQPDNPWIERVGLLTEALESVEAELKAAESVTPGPFSEVPPHPVTELHISQENGIHIGFDIGAESFSFDEETDWAERGFQIAKPVLCQTAGDAARLVPDGTPESLRAELAIHLADAITTLATDIRDRIVEGESLPASMTLADLARPCPVCGGWTDHKGHCRWCAERRARAQTLFQERTRLLADRTHESEERHRIADRLALARARMANLERELASLD